MFSCSTPPHICSEFLHVSGWGGNHSGRSRHCLSSQLPSFWGGARPAAASSAWELSRIFCTSFQISCSCWILTSLSVVDLLGECFSRFARGRALVSVNGTVRLSAQANCGHLVIYPVIPYCVRSTFACNRKRICCWSTSELISNKLSAPAVPSLGLFLFPWHLSFEGWLLEGITLTTSAVVGSYWPWGGRITQLGRTGRKWWNFAFLFFFFLEFHCFLGLY